MARPRGSRNVRGWMMTPTEMARAGLIDPADLERVEQGKGEHAVMVTRLKTSAIERLDLELERIRQNAKIKDDEFFLVDSEGAQKELASLVEAKQSTKAPRSGVERKLFAEEKRIRNNSYETGILIASDGRVLRQKGNTYSVDFSPEQKESAPGSVFTHNHPGVLNTDRSSMHMKIGGSGFSVNDIAAANYYRMAEIRAVTPRLTYSMKNKDWLKEWEQDQYRSESSKGGEYKRFIKKYESKANEVRTKLGRLQIGGKLSTEEARATFWHLVARDFAASNRGYGAKFTYRVEGAKDALAELARIEKIYDAG